MERRGRLIAVGIGVVLALVILVLLGIWLIRCEPEEGAGVEAGVADAPLPADQAGVDRAVVADTTAEPRPAPKPTRRINPVELRKVQRRYSASIRVCYDRTGRRAPSMVARRANVVVELAAGGRVRSVTVHAGGDREIEGCIRRAVRGWRFSSSLKAQRVEFPIVFR
jgi:hypothetical protein